MTTAVQVDVAVIGGGVVGCAVARELAGREVSVALIESRGDVGDATSKANTAILHTGFDAVPGSLESSMVRRVRPAVRLRGGGRHPGRAHGSRAGGWAADELALPGLADKAVRNGYDSCEVVDAAAVYAMVPALGPGALGGLVVPDESIICPWTTTLAYATEAQQRGALLLLGRRVTGVAVGTEATTISTTAGEVRAAWIVNAAGLGGDMVDRMLGHDRFTVVPRRGELLVFDKLARALVDRIVLPVPSAKGKGVLVSPTIFGNVMLGPTSENLVDRSDTSTSAEGFAFLTSKGRTIMPALLDEEVTASYAGLRAATEHSDYVVEVDPAQRYVLLGGIRSTGLTASMALAERACDLMEAAGLSLHVRAGVPPPPRMPNIGEAFPRPYQRVDLIEHDPEYGTIVCFCERVSRGEIRDALRSPIPPCDADGLRRRTRALMGRCQGFFCGAEVEAMLREQT
jgi:glycerol-3-phosphate dehydrogenase